MSLKHTFISAKVDGGDSTIVQPSNWNADHIIDANGVIVVANTVAPATPASGNITVFGKLNAGSGELGIVMSDGSVKYMAPSFGHKKIGFWNVGGAGSVFTNNTDANAVSIGMEAPNYQGFLTNQFQNSTSLLTSAKRINVSSATTVNAGATLYGNNGQYLLGSIAKQGGFKCVFRWACTDGAAVTNAVAFVGLGTSVVSGGGNVTSRLNLFGVGTDIADVNFSFINNDGVGVATKTLLGANFPAHTPGVIYELTLYSAPNSGFVSYQLVNLSSGNAAYGSVNIDLPALTAMLVPSIMRNNGNPSGTLSVSYDFLMFYAETDF